MTFGWREFSPLLAGVAAFGQRPSRRPNLLLLMADDLGWGDVGFHGSEFPTPNIDRIAKQGAQFSHYYAYPLVQPHALRLAYRTLAVRIGHSRPLRPQ